MIFGICTQVDKQSAYSNTGEGSASSSPFWYQFPQRRAALASPTSHLARTAHYPNASGFSSKPSTQRVSLTPDVSFTPLREPSDTSSHEGVLHLLCSTGLFPKSLILKLCSNCDIRVVENVTLSFRDVSCCLTLRSGIDIGVFRGICYILYIILHKKKKKRKTKGERHGRCRLSGTLFPPLSPAPSVKKTMSQCQQPDFLFIINSLRALSFKNQMSQLEQYPFITFRALL